MELQARPIYPGPTPWSFDSGGGLDAETLRRARMTEELLTQARHDALAARQQRDILALEAGPASLQFTLGQSQRTPVTAPVITGAAVGVESGLGYDPLVLAGGTAGANAVKIDTTLGGGQQQLMQQGSGGPSLDPLQAGMAAADLASTAFSGAGSRQLPLTSPAPLFAPQPVVARAGLSRDAIAEALGQRAATSAAPEPVNVSGGGPGTSTAKGEATIARQAAKRAGFTGLLESVDDAFGRPDLGIGGMAERGLQRAGAMARGAGMKNLGGALFRAGGAARVLAPAAAVGGAVLPAVMGAVEGYGQAGAGGAVIQGGAGAAGALAGGAIGTAILPGVGTVIGAGIGSMLGSGAGGGLTGLAQGAVEKAQQGDTSFMGGIGRALDPLIDTPFEKEQKAVLQQMNSPAMQAIRQQERARQEQVRADQMEALLMQSYTR
jgi:hypothetical protein